MAKKREYTNHWQFNNAPLLEIPDNAVGFVYVITDKETGKKYIGKKNFYSTRKLKPTDKRKTRIESDWKHYYSSSPILKEIASKRGIDSLQRDIIAICTTERDMNYLEVKFQFKFNVLEEPEKWYNENINGNWYPKNYVGIHDRTQYGAIHYHCTQ